MTGKEKCYELKKLREQIAKENGIEGFEFKECNFEGECEGYCPACDEEARNLELLIIEKNFKETDNKKIKAFNEQNETQSPESQKTMGMILPPEDMIKGKMILPIDEDKEFFEDEKKKPRGIFKNKRLDHSTVTKGIVVSKNKKEKKKREKSEGKNKK